MKTCAMCSSTAFDDMPVCYGCLEPFEKTTAKALEECTLYPKLAFSDYDMIVEEPKEDLRLSGLQSISTEAMAGTEPDAAHNIDTAKSKIAHEAERTSARFHVVMSELFGYDIYLEKVEKKELSVGCARDNNIVLPHTESRRHPVRIFFSQGQLWVEDRQSKQQVEVDGIALTGTRCLKQGAIIKVGEATIELIEA